MEKHEWEERLEKAFDDYSQKVLITHNLNSLEVIEQEHLTIGYLTALLDTHMITGAQFDEELGRLNALKLMI